MRDRQGRDFKVRVAVLGGGMGALAAAWQLVRSDPDRYDITVYQRGWRLGGKGASGRNRKPGHGLRIEEHGLHILMGFYDQVFEVLKTCYDDLGDGPLDAAGSCLGSWSEALIGADHIHVCDRYRDGHREIWELQLPARAGEVPGGRAPRDEPDIAAWIRNGLAFLYQTVLQFEQPPSSDLPSESVPPRLPWLERLARLLQRRGEETPGASTELAGVATRNGIRWALSFLFWRLGDPERRDPQTIARRRQCIAAYFVGANLLGMVEHRLFRKVDFQRAAANLDQLDYREWLRRSAAGIGDAWPELTWNSPLVSAIYDLIFSRQCGFGAGTALYDTLSMLLGYQGHVYYRMNGGMGDVVFAPLYLWLRRQGVKFRFFHRVRELRPGRPGGRTVDEIVIEEQANLGGKDYAPLFPVNGRPCWPSMPFLEQFPASERRRVERAGYDFETSEATFGPLRRLQRGSDFDQVVLGLPLGVLQDDPLVIGALAAAHPPLAEMVHQLRTVRTRALQLWTDQQPQALGWPGARAMLGSYDPPFTSWADMSHLLPREAWGDATAVGGVHYFCDVYEGADEGSGETVREQAVEWMERSITALMPGFSWERLHAPAGVGRERLAAQYWRANTSGSDRYVVAAPGTLRFRLSPDGSGFHNLFLAGDWVKTDLNVGCVEAAAQAGVGAARALHAKVPGPLVELAFPDRPAGLYVDRDSDWVLRPPVWAPHVTSAAFVLRADPAALRALCAHQVDGPSGGQVTASPWPLDAGVVMLICSDLPRVQSADEQHARLGSFHEHDVGFFVPVDVRSREGKRAHALLLPYLFVDSAIGMLAGREIYGFSKLLARIDMPPPSPRAGFEGALSITVHADVLTPAPGGQVEESMVVQVRGSDAARAPRKLPPGLWRYLPGMLGRSLVGAATSGALIPGARPSVAAPMLFLKQFRDANLGHLACHQSLVLCGARAAPRGTPRRLHGTFTVRLPRHLKPDLAGALGLPEEMQTELALQMKHDLFLPVGVQLWP